MMAATIAWKAEVKDAKKKILLDGERERERKGERENQITFKACSCE